VAETARIIPFGTARAPNTWMTRSSTGDGFAVRVPFVTVAEGSDGALRLGDPIARSHPASEPADENQLAGLRRTLLRHCDPWRRSQHRFLERYFDFVASHVEDYRDELAEKLEPFAGLFQYRDWVYSALMPLPRAHLHAPESGKPFGPESLVPVDFAFWTGGVTIAVDTPGKGTQSSTTERRHDRLRGSGAKVIELSDDVLESSKQTDFEAALPADFRRFWRDIALPSGPLKPAALDVEASEI